MDKEEADSEDDEDGDSRLMESQTRKDDGYVWSIWRSASQAARAHLIIIIFPHHRQHHEDHRRL